jgi:hypothetical protein
MKTLCISAALVSLLACSDDPAPCEIPTEVVTTLDRNNPDIMPLLQRCEDNAMDCEALCAHVYETLNGGAPDTLAFSECHLLIQNGMTALRYVELPECAQDEEQP